MCCDAYSYVLLFRNNGGCDCGLTYKQIAEQLTDLGYNTTVDECKNAKRAKLPKHAVTSRMIVFIRELLKLYPAMDLYQIFS